MANKTKMLDGLVVQLDVGQEVDVLFVGNPLKPCCTSARLKIVGAYAGGFNGGYVAQVVASADASGSLLPGFCLNLQNDGSIAHLPDGVPVLNYLGGVPNEDAIYDGCVPGGVLSYPPLYGDVLIFGEVERVRSAPVDPKSTRWAIPNYEE